MTVYSVDIISFYKHLVETNNSGVSSCKKILLSLLLIVITTAGVSAFASVEGYTVGDETQGQWIQFYPNSESCLISGPPAPGSPWPTPTADSYNGGGAAYTIKGNYKLSLGSTFAPGSWGWSPPSCSINPNCIDGYDEAVAQSLLVFWHLVPGYLHPNETLTLAGTLFTKTYTDPYTEYKQYSRVCSRIKAYYVWQWNLNQTPCTECNQGPPQCPFPGFK